MPTPIDQAATHDNAQLVMYCLSSIGRTTGLVPHVVTHCEYHLLLLEPHRAIRRGPGLRIRAVTGWPVWRERYRVLAVLAMVELLALALPAIAWTPASLTNLDLALLLASLSVTYSLFVVRWERARRLLLFERTPAMTPDMLAIWCFAAALLLPPQVAASITAVTAA